MCNPFRPPRFDWLRFLIWMLLIFMTFCVWMAVASAVRAQELDAKPVNLDDNKTLLQVLTIWKWDIADQQTYIDKTQLKIGGARVHGALIIQGQRVVSADQAAKLVAKDLYGRDEKAILSSLGVIKLSTKGVGNEK